MGRITPETFRGYKDRPLVGNDLIRFDTSQDGELKPADFAGRDEEWNEFVQRYANSSYYVREQYRNNASANLAIDLSWSLVNLWRSEGLTEREKERIAGILDGDFRIDVKEVTDRESIKSQYFEASYWTGAGAGTDFNEDTVRDSDSFSRYAYAYTGTNRPFRLLGDNLLFSPNINFSGAYINGRRRLEGQPREDYDYLHGSGSIGLQLRDLMDEEWSVGGDFSYTDRTEVPDGFPDRSYNWNSNAQIDHAHRLPIRLSLGANGLREFYAPPAEEGQNHRSVDAFNTSASLVMDLASRWALIGSHKYEEQDKTGTYTTSDREKHKGSLGARRRSLEGYFDLGFAAKHIQSARSHRTPSGTETEETSTINFGPAFELFSFLGQEKSINAFLMLSAIKSRGDLDAWYGGYDASIKADVYLISKILEGSITGELSHELVYQDGYNYYLWYAARPSLTLHITDDFTVGTGASIEQTRNSGGLNERETNASGSAFANYHFSVFDGLDLKLSGNGGRNWDQNPDPEERNYDSRFASAEVQASLKF